MALNLSSILDGSSATVTGGEGGVSQISLSGIASGFLQNIANSAASAVGNKINPPRSQNTQPTPDLTAAAARPAVSTFLDSSAFGVSTPILLVGVAALAFVLLRR